MIEEPWKLLLFSKTTVKCWCAKEWLSAYG